MIIKKKFEERVHSAVDEVAEILIQKNHKYGDSALNPSRIFSTQTDIEGLLVRIDDKLSRVKCAGGFVDYMKHNDEDVINDLIGYLLLLKLNIEN